MNLDCTCPEYRGADCPRCSVPRPAYQSETPMTKITPEQRADEAAAIQAYRLATGRAVTVTTLAGIMAAAEAIISARKTREIPTIDLDAHFWGNIQKAAAQATWMPEQYTVNDWVNDVCAFLRDGPTASPEEKAFKKLRELCGYVENSTEMRVMLMQDDASREWLIFLDRALISSDRNLLQAISQAHAKQAQV